MTSLMQRWWGRLSRISIRQIDLIIAVAVTFAALLLFDFAGLAGSPIPAFLFLQNIELRSLDLRFVLRGQRPPDPRIVVVGIDEQTLQKISAFPLPRSSYVQLVKQLSAGGARVIAFDATFPTPESNPTLEALEKLQREVGSSASPAVIEKIKQVAAASDQDSLFAAALKQAGNVVLGHLFLARAGDPKLAEEYFNIAWAQSFPQVFPVFSKPGQKFDMGEVWAQKGGVVAHGVQANIAKLAEAAASFGFIDINPDSDGTLRHALLMIRYEDQDYFPSLALQVLREYEKIPDQEIAAYIAADGLERIQFGRHLLWPSPDATALINYTGPYGSYPHYSMWDVMTGTVPPQTFKDKIVLVGATAKAIGDIRNTPFQKRDSVYMGVEVHANILDNLLHSDEKGRGFLVRGFKEEMTDLAFILVFGLGFGFWFSRTRPLLATVSLLIALAGFTGFLYYSFVHAGRWLGFVIPAGTLVANYAAITTFRMIFEERDKRMIRKTFSQYMPPGVITLIEKDPQKYIRPGGESKELTVMFSDIRDFTTISEGMTPDELVQLLNEYLGEMTDVLFRNLGTLDKYIGDAIMAFWGSPYPQPDHALRACHCAVEMLKSLEVLNAKFAAQGRKEIAIGVGINTGPVNVGTMGSVKRLSWTVMGDNVNLASRLEGMTKQFRTRIVISETTYREVAKQFVCRDLDKIRVKGKLQPVNVYEIMGTMEDRPKFQALLERFEYAMTAYRSQNWLEAAGRFGELLSDYPEDGPTQIFLQRALEFLENAPEPDWDGVYVMKSK
ncbi:MAG TPA: adenylate/guanylate cyclase domain-containing protein [Terriglobales bacterium]|jgi:adenylate cyclase|nr:adenylate/guanylate cyclase domain-containing protein [Terriglobales bacterium]